MKENSTQDRSPYIDEGNVEMAIEKLEDFLMDELDVKSYSEMVLLFESLKDVWQRDNTHQDIAEGVHLDYQQKE